MARSSRVLMIVNAVDRASPTFKQVSGSIKNLGLIAGGVAAIQVGRELVGALESSVAAAGEFESELTKLAVALRAQGENTNATRNELLQYAEAVEQSSNATLSQVVSGIAMAKSMGASNEQAKLAVRAATDMSQALGVDLDASIRQVVRSFSGYIGELNQSAGGLEGLTKEQLKNGDAARILIERYKGVGDAIANTFEGSVNNARTAAEKLQVAIGAPFRDVATAFINEAMIPAANAATQFFERSKFLRDGILEAAIAIAELGAVLEPAARKLLSFAVAFGALSFAQGIDAIKALTGQLQDLGIGGDTSETALGRLAARLRELKAASLDVRLDELGVGAAPDAGPDPDVVKKFEKLADLQRSSFLKTAQLAVDLTDTLEEQHAAELVLLNARQEDERRLWDEHFESLKLTREQAANERSQLEQQQAAESAKLIKRQTADKKAAARAESEINRMIAAEAVATLQAVFGENKAFAVATATIHTWEGVARALKAADPPLNFVLAGLVAARGLAAVAQIRKSSPKGFQLGGPVEGRPGVDTVPALLTPGEFVLSPEQTEQLFSGPSVPELHLHGDLATLVDEINLRVDDGESRLVASELRTSRMNR